MSPHTTYITEKWARYRPWLNSYQCTIAGGLYVNKVLATITTRVC